MVNNKNTQKVVNQSLEVLSEDLSYENLKGIDNEKNEELNNKLFGKELFINFEPIFDLIEEIIENSKNNNI